VAHTSNEETHVIGSTKTALAATRNCNTAVRRVARRASHIACITAVTVTLTVGSARADDTDRVVAPPVPANIQAPAGNRAFLVAHAVGTQNYICLPSTTSDALVWTFLGPQATLFNDELKQVITHFLSPNPIENGFGRATWQHSRDTSAVWGQMIQSSSDPSFVAAGAIPWLLLRVVGAQEGPTGGGRLAAATFIQRLNTVGGVAPSTSCSELGTRMLVPYEADYVFYEKARRHTYDRD
jgi:hypothetical protein